MSAAARRLARAGAAGALAVGLAVAASAAAAQQPSRLGEAADVLGRLIEAYGVSGHEAPVRDAVLRLLPAWASPAVDSAGNVVVRAGAGAPLVVFVAHMDEIGFIVTAIRDDGRLELRPAGGFYPSLFEAEPGLVHTARGIVPAVFAPRDSAGAAPRRSPGALRVDPGTTSRLRSRPVPYSKDPCRLQLL